MPVERISAFIRGASDESFEELALAAFRSQYERVDSFRDICDRRGATPARVSDWRQIPAVPISTPEGLEPVDRSPDPDLLRAVIDHSFPAACLRGMGCPPVLSLIPTGEDPPDPDLAFTADRLLRAWAAPDSFATARRGVDVAKARSFLGARQRDRRPTLVLAASASLARLLEALDRRGLRFRLPPGSRVIETGGPGPESPKPESTELLTRLADGLAVPAEGLTREHGVIGLTSRFYAGYDRRGEPRPFLPPPWVRARVLDPGTLAPAPAGAQGVLAVFDLASSGAAAHLLTGDLAVAEESGFRLAGRSAATAA